MRRGGWGSLVREQRQCSHQKEGEKEVSLLCFSNDLLKYWVLKACRSEDLRRSVKAQRDAGRKTEGKVRALCDLYSPSSPLSAWMTWVR